MNNIINLVSIRNISSPRVILHLLQAQRDAAPLLLLDEVAAHLDRDRREALFDEIYGLNAQVWLTGTDVATFDRMRDRAQFLDVQDGCARLIS